MVRPFIALLTATLVVAACERPSGDAEARELAVRALPDMLTYPQSQIVSVSSGAEAAEVRLSAAVPPDSVTAWYRRFLVMNGWELTHDARQPDGTVIIHASKGGRPLWITVAANTGGPGTSYTLIGVAPPADSTR